MNDRTYRLIFGALILIFLYFELQYLMYALIAILYLEGVTNWRVPLLFKKLRDEPITIIGCDPYLAPMSSRYHFNFDAERAWRLAIGILLSVTFLLFYDKLWFVPWFLGFAILGAGVSGVCPGLMAIKWIGFR